MSRRRARPARGCLARLVRAGCLLAVVAGLAAAGAGGWAWWTIGRPYQGFPGEETTVVVEPGTPASAILAQLEEAGVLADHRLARLTLVHLLGDPPLVAGEYLFAGPASTREVLGKLIRGEVVLHRVTLIEGQTLAEAAAAFTAAGFGETAAFVAAFSDPAPIADLDPLAQDLEGYLFPETYDFAGGTPPKKIAAALVATFRARWAAEVEPRRAAEAARTGTPTRSVRDLVTLASIVEKEARLDSERPVVAGVYANRLRIGMALYADPTVIYALKRLGRWDGNLRRPDLQLDSPWNTYRYPGLPPGPIASPGLASLTAAAAPADVPYLYFVSKNDGSHVFAETLAEHNRNVDEWQRRWWREKWAREGRR